MARRRKASCSYKRGNTGFNINRRCRSGSTGHTRTSKKADVGMAILAFLCGGLF